MEETKVDQRSESPEYVRTSLAAAMTMGMIPGKFLNETKLYCINLLLTYAEGCVGKCAYCGLSKSRMTQKPWRENSFIRVNWPTVTIDDVISRIKDNSCSHVERICVSMITNGRARKDVLTVVNKLHENVDLISALITPTLIDKAWLQELKTAGADKVGVAVDAATLELFEKFRGRNVQGPHNWDKYWKTVEEAVDVFGRTNVGVHLIVGLGETEEEMVKTIQRAQDLGAKTHLFSFFPEDCSPMQGHPQPPIGNYRRIQLARYLINQGVTSANKMRFNKGGQLTNFGLDEALLNQIIESGQPFMTSGCSGKTMENACNRPFGNCTPYQAYIGELRNFPYQPADEDITRINKQRNEFSESKNQEKSSFTYEKD